MPDQTAAALSVAGSAILDISISSADRAVLRRLAAEVAELAARPIEAAKRELWYQHNALAPTRPLVFCDPENGWNEIFPQRDLECTGELARTWEMRLRKEVFWGAEMRDDRVAERIFVVPYVFEETDWGLHETKHGGEDGGSYVWDAPVRSYADDLPRLRFPAIEVDQGATARMVATAAETLGDLLDVQLRGSWWWSLGMTWTLIRLRGLEQFMLDMLDDPEGLHRIMAFLRDGNLARLDFLEEHGLLSLNNDGTYVGSGGFGWSRELPGARLRGQGPADRHVGIRRVARDGRRLALDVRRVRPAVPDPDPRAVRAELLWLLRATRQALGLRRPDSPAAARLRLGLGQRTGHGRATRRPLHLLLEASPRRPRQPPLRRGRRPLVRPGDASDDPRLPSRGDHEGQPHDRERPPAGRPLGRDSPRGERGANLTTDPFPRGKGHDSEKPSGGMGALSLLARVPLPLSLWEMG